MSCPFSTKHLSNGHAGLLVCFIWFYSLSLTALPLFGWGEYVNEGANIRYVEFEFRNDLNLYCVVE